MGGFVIRDSFSAGPGPGLRSCLLSLQPQLQYAFAPGSLVQAQQALVDVIADSVIKAGAVVSNHEDDHPDSLAGHKRNLGVESGKVSAVEGKEVAPVGRRLTAPPVGGIQELPVTPRLRHRIGER